MEKVKIIATQASAVSRLPMLVDRLREVQTSNNRKVIAGSKLPYLKGPDLLVFMAGMIMQLSDRWALKLLRKSEQDSR